MPDDSRLHAWAKKKGARFVWRTWKKDTHWHAMARAWKGDKSIGRFGTSTTVGEQAALDYVIDLLTTEPAEPRSEPINLADQLRAGKPRG